jgi:hypothetical protein
MYFGNIQSQRCSEEFIPQDDGITTRGTAYYLSSMFQMILHA